MFCRNCGNPVEDVSVICTKCGVPKGQGSNFCPNCGVPTSPLAVVCVKCGVALGASASVPYGYQQKSRLAAGLFGIFIGGLGVHNFYLGNTSRGVIQLILTVCSCGIGSIWGFIEGILILCGQINTDANNIPLKE
ncbi:MAG: TM2 domain-containing protein [Clostridia bacterium]|nr:TM2 domain-containing protein [Clostridia bacterium]